jgi:hypothetical protein
MTPLMACFAFPVRLPSDPALRLQIISCGVMSQSALGRRSNVPFLGHAAYMISTVSRHAA